MATGEGESGGAGGSGSGAGAGGQGGGDKGDGKGAMPGLEQYDRLVAGMQTLAASVDSIQKRLDSQKDRQDEDGADDEENLEDEGAEDDEELDEKTLETLPRKALLDHILKKTSKLLEKNLNTMQKSVNSVQQAAAREKVVEQVNKLASEKKDFWDWKDEIKQIAEASPGISPQRAYALARIENPDKAKKLDEKYKVGEDKGKPGDSGEPKNKRKFGGFTPGSGVVHSNQKMAKNEAAEKAWDEVMGPLGAGEGT